MLESDPRRKPSFAAVVCHPHPLHGGTMHNKVVFRAAKAAVQAGLPTLRFNFRGVGKSAGSFSAKLRTSGQPWIILTLVFPERVLVS
jgi:alpha/beta superfamily hydrolase